MVLWLLIQLPTYFHSVTTGNTASLGKGHVLQGGKCLGFGSFEGSTFGWDVYEEHVYPSACSELSWANPPAESSDLGDKGCHPIAVQWVVTSPLARLQGEENLCARLNRYLIAFRSLSFFKHWPIRGILCGDVCQWWMGCSCLVWLNSTPASSSMSGKAEMRESALPKGLTRWCNVVDTWSP